MYSILKKISIEEQVSVEKDTFSNAEIGHLAEVKFNCCNCGHENTIKITPYESGFPIFQLYNEEKVLAKNELLRNKIVSETSKNSLYFGELTVNDLPTLYFGTDCPSCRSKYICVFSYGEKQPGLTLLTISGVWKYNEI
ncbi:putative RNA-binding Zn-ribbon protein involved in translation (DUF1610 family) [Pedobacter sp. AK013]|uniref:hypothetical protein n=1 Tax=Pedobacter sp. AK013 TaxID=2723071 RepID=UPI0016184320|nr:hypothetical protein [Pedobacter sp. AK013]MBB6235910.1 putative RNA-binding Zn-ribbon protein involved in translation (DUF1610 family) [Pedobacter sp. AK013]